MRAGFLASTGRPRQSRDDYDDGYHRHRSNNVWYSSDCCYKKVVRHERSVHYRRIDNDGYYDRPSYYDQPYRRSYTNYDTPRRYDTDRYYSGYSNYSSYSSYADSCYLRSVRIDDNRGGWVWGTRRVCN